MMKTKIVHFWGYLVVRSRALLLYGALIWVPTLTSFSAQSQELSVATAQLPSMSHTLFNISYLSDIKNKKKISLELEQSIETLSKVGFVGVMAISNPIASRFSLSLERFELGAHWHGPLKLGVLIPITFPNSRLLPTSTLALTGYAQRTFQVLVNRFHLNLELLSDCYRYSHASSTLIAVSLAFKALLVATLTEQTSIASGFSILASGFSLPIQIQYWPSEHFGWIVGGKFGLSPNAKTGNDDQSFDGKSQSFKLLQSTISGAWQF